MTFSEWLVLVLGIVVVAAVFIFKFGPVYTWVGVSFAIGAPGLTLIIKRKRQKT